MTGVMTLLLIITLTLLVNRIAATALTMTGMSREMAKFQARSAFSTVGFCTSEAEAVVNHPVRRRIISLLMFSGNVGFVSIVAVGVGSFAIQTEESGLNLAGRIGWLVAGIAFLWLVASSKWVDDKLFKLISWMLSTFTQLEVHDFTSMLQLGEGYSVTRMNLGEDCWPIGMTLAEARLSELGVNVLGIRRADKSFVGTPIGVTYFRKHDELILYGNREDITTFGTSLKENSSLDEQRVRVRERHAETESREARSEGSKHDGEEHG